MPFMDGSLGAIERRMRERDFPGGGLLGPAGGEFGGGFSLTDKLSELMGGMRPGVQPFLPMGGFDMGDRIREVGNAVRRRLAELSGGSSQPQFLSPQLLPEVRRGRFGT